MVDYELLNEILDNDRAEWDSELESIQAQAEAEEEEKREKAGKAYAEAQSVLTYSEQIASNYLLSEFDDFLRFRYKIGIEDVKPTYLAGMWVTEKPLKMNPHDHCLSQTHTGKFNIEYLDPRKDRRGRFQSPHKTWLAHMMFLGKL